MPKTFKGLGVSGGTGVGKARIIDCSCPEYELRKIEDTDKELGRFVKALKKFCDNTRAQIAMINDTVGKRESEILSSHIKMTHDLALQSSLITKISNGMCAEQATSEICDEYIHRFLNSGEVFVQQLATDVKDVKTCVINLLLNRPDVQVEDFGEDVVVISKELTPSVIARLDKVHTKAIITEVGCKVSHGCLLTRALGIPAITQVENVDSLFCDGELVEVDGISGIITVK